MAAGEPGIRYPAHFSTSGEAGAHFKPSLHCGGPLYDCIVVVIEISSVLIGRRLIVLHVMIQTCSVIVVHLTVLTAVMSCVLQKVYSKVSSTDYPSRTRKAFWLRHH